MHRFLHTDNQIIWMPSLCSKVYHNLCKMRDFAFWFNCYLNFVAIYWNAVLQKYENRKINENAIKQLFYSGSGRDKWFPVIEHAFVKWQLFVNCFSWSTNSLCNLTRTFYFRCLQLHTCIGNAYTFSQLKRINQKRRKKNRMIRINYEKLSKTARRVLTLL